MEEAVALGHEAPLRKVGLDAHFVAATLDVHLHTVEEVTDGRCGLPRPERHSTLLTRLQAAYGVVVETQVFLRPQDADKDGGVAPGHGLRSGNTDQDLKQGGTCMKDSSQSRLTTLWGATFSSPPLPVGPI